MARSQRTPELRRIGDAMRRVREQRGETQAQVANCAGISAQHYRDIERGDQSSRRTTYLKIARALDITPDEMDRITGKRDTEGVSVS